MTTDATTNEDHTGLSRVVADLQRLDVVHDPHVGPDPHLIKYLATMPGTLVDATFVYNTHADRKFNLSADLFPSVKPPWSQSFIGFVNNNNYAIVMAVDVYPYSDEILASFAAQAAVDFQPPRLSADEQGWMLAGSTFIGVPPGDGHGHKTCGPVSFFYAIIGVEGELVWSMGTSRDEFRQLGRQAGLVTLATFSLLNSTNCSIVESPLSRPLRRTEQRYGVRSHVIQVTTSNRARRGGSRAGEPSTITYPLSSVRGHHAHYGDCCPRFHEPKGLLFGKLTGRVWVPQYARGDESVGRVEQTFIVDEGE